ncbi:MAG: efflux RND transporter permease subunit [Rikenellaceae bacterium]|jgi:HAE1 family hydrophobic/amphiphilic exporter-1|nr:efflux RND transporter permease subunit [Rikenellaceae bacterium]
MKIYEASVRKPISTILIFVGVIVLGLFSLRNLAIDMYPDIEAPYISVITTYEGANAADIETNVTRILEDNLNTVNNLKKITSKSQDNFSMITLEFEWGADLTEAANDVRDVVGRVQSLLPDEVDAPTIFKFSSSMMPVLMLSATAEESYAALYKILDDKLVNTLNRIDGVGAVSVMGAPYREIQINVDPHKLEAYNLTVEGLGQIIAAENINIPGGTLDIGNHVYNIKADLEFKDSRELSEIIIANRGGKDIFLRDVAQVKDTIEKVSNDVRMNGNRAMSIMIQKQSGANSVQIARDVLDKVEDIKGTLPADVKLSTIFDTSESIQDSINSLSETVMLAFVFVILVVLFFLGRWRATLIICLTIPISLIVAFIYLYMTGSTLNIISLSSLSIAIGMVVDDAIVVLENITTHIEKGSSPKEAAVYGTNEVWLAVIATTLTVVAVFLPLTMLTGMAGIMFKELGWIVTLVIVTSTVAAITLTPMLSAKLLRARAVGHTYKGLGIIFKPIDRFLDKLDHWYSNLLKWALRHRTGVLIATGLIFFSSLGLLSKVPAEFFPASDDGMISATVKLDQNIAVEYTSTIARRIDSTMYANYPEVRLLYASAGAASGNNSFAAMQESGSQIISYRFRLSDLKDRTRTIFEISDLMRKDLAMFPEIKEFTVTPGQSSGGMGGGSNIEVKVFGYDLNVSNNVAEDLKAKMSDLPTLRDVHLSRDDMRTEYNIEFDRNRLAFYGLNTSTAAMCVRNRINGLTASKYREDGDEYDIVVRYGEPFRRSLDEVENIMIFNPGGQAIRLRDVATITEEYAPPTIQRENRQRVVSVIASLGHGIALGTAAEEVNALLADYHSPEGIDIVIGGTLEDQQEAFGDILILLVLIIMLVYIVMATQFESFKMPFIIMFTLPFAFTGVFLALFLTGTPLSVIALIGAIMLVGIVVKNGIVMVDFTNLLRERGEAVNQAVINSGKSRLRPVLMTSLTTILGMVPMAMGMGEGSEIWQPMGIAVIGGLTFSLVLTLIVIPVMYSVFGGNELKKQRARDRKQRELAEAEAAAAN